MTAQEQPGPAGGRLGCARRPFFMPTATSCCRTCCRPALLAEMNAAIDRDHAERAYFWDSEVSRNGTSNLLLTEPVFERRSSACLPYCAQVEALMGGPVCFEELSVQITKPSEQGQPDRLAPGLRPLACPPAWPRLPADHLLLVTDVGAGDHHFTISPEPAGGARFWTRPRSLHAAAASPSGAAPGPAFSLTPPRCTGRRSSQRPSASGASSRSTTATRPARRSHR